ncbi:putative membrane protein YiaA [Arthrobacter sp. JUb119]|uniref:hypothetical protein n=2 Tax=unclassified Glutamicibacter TaxID=2627139 RepID=UPI002A30B25E|nr:putative membrane protein YiaA [Arthrobacter sp. JUb119]
MTRKDEGKMAEHQRTPQLDSLVESAQSAIASAAERSSFVLPYTAPDHRPNPAVEPFDTVRGYLLGASGLLLLLTSLALSSGLHGRAPSSLLDTSLVHSVLWPATAIALVLSAAFSLRRNQLSARRQRIISVYSIPATAMMACAITLASGFLAISAAILATIASLLSLYGVLQLNRNTARNRLERWATDAPVSFFAGSSLVYALQLWFAAAGWNDGGQGLPAVVVAAGISVVAAAFAHSERGRHAFASGFGICMIAAAIQGWLNESAPLWVCAVWIFMALLVFLMAENRRFQISHAEHRAQRGKPIEF